jgi:hypothetical protein
MVSTPKLPCINCITLAICKATIKSIEDKTKDTNDYNVRYSIYWFTLYKKCSLFRIFFELTEFIKIENRDLIFKLFNIKDKNKWQEASGP